MKKDKIAIIIFIAIISFILLMRAQEKGFIEVTTYNCDEETKKCQTQGEFKALDVSGSQSFTHFSIKVNASVKQNSPSPIDFLTYVLLGKRSRTQ